MCFVKEKNIKNRGIMWLIYFLFNVTTSFWCCYFYIVVLEQTPSVFISAHMTPVMPTKEPARGLEQLRLIVAHSILQTSAH